MPMYGLASAGASLLSGWLAGALHGLSFSFAFVTFGPIDGILGAAGLAVVAGGIAVRGALEEVAAGPKPMGADA